MVQEIIGLNQSGAIPGFGQLYYTNTLPKETITILYYTYTNTIQFFLEDVFMHAYYIGKNSVKPKWG